MMGMMGAGMLLWSIIGVVAVVLVVIGAVWAVRTISESDAGQLPRPRRRSPARLSTSDPADPAQAELRRRYAAGEISREEYLQGKVDLE